MVNKEDIIPEKLEDLLFKIYQEIDKAEVEIYKDNYGNCKLAITKARLDFSIILTKYTKYKMSF